MKLVASTKLPVPTMEISGNFNGGIPVTTANLAMWLGDPQGTSLTPAALLDGWAVNGDSAMHSGTVLVSRPAAGFDHLYIEEPAPSSSQLQVLDHAGMNQSPGPITIDIQVSSSQTSGVLGSVKDDLAAIIHDLTLGRGLFAMLYTAEPPSQLPTSYRSYAGPIHPAQTLTPPPSQPGGGGGYGYVCTAGWGEYMGLSNGLIRPVQVLLISVGNGIAYGFTPGEFMVDNNHAGFDVTDWYSIPGVTVPTPGVTGQNIGIPSTVAWDQKTYEILPQDVIMSAGTYLGAGSNPETKKAFKVYSIPGIDPNIDIAVVNPTVAGGEPVRATRVQ